MTTPSSRACVVATIAAVVASVAIAHAFVLAVLALPPTVALLRAPTGRRALAHRLFFVAPLALLAVGARATAGTSTVECALPALRVVVAVAWTSWLVHALPARAIDEALRALGMPETLVALLGQTRRFGAQLVGTLDDAWSAATLRGARTSTRAAIASAGSVVGIVVVRAFDRAEQVAIAASLRGEGTDAREETP